MTSERASGRQHAIAAHGYEACVASVGASLRVLSYRGRDLVMPFSARATRPAMSGALLVPWPNRTADGTYEFDGRTHRLHVNEPGRHTANHGLVADLDFAVRAKAPDRVVLGAALAPSPGYPWPLDVEVAVGVSARGLAHTVTVRNHASTVAPVGMGVHPYLLAGPAATAAVDAWMLEIPAGEAMLVTPDRLLPDRIVPVDAAGHRELDFRAPRTIGATALNHGFTSLRRGPDGLARARLTDASGAGVEMAVDGAYRWIQAYTSDEASGGRVRAALALEPMTCPVDALNSKRDLLVLGPGEAVSATFWLRGLDGG